MKRTLRTKIWCGVLVVACVSGVAFGVANLPRVQAEAVSGGVEVTEAPGNEAVVSEESKAEVPDVYKRQASNTTTSPGPSSRRSW